jgi:hypothetical protein
MELARQRFVSGSVTGLVSRTPSGPPEFRSRERLIIDPQRGAFRVEHGDSSGRRQVFISDGKTTWTQNFRGGVIANSSGPRHIPTRAIDLLDPSWLVDYNYTKCTEERHNVRDVLCMSARLSSIKAICQSRMNIYAFEVEAIIDARLGFLHRLTQFIDNQPFQRVELGDLELDPVLDGNVFQSM